MPSVSKQQQKFFGLVRALQKGDVSPSSVSKKARDAAKDMKKSDVKKFASTKHKGLPRKVKGETKVKSLIKKMVREMLDEIQLDEKCWKGYEKKGTKMMFGKRYPNCVKKEGKIKEGVKFSSSQINQLVKAFKNVKGDVLPKNHPLMTQVTKLLKQTDKKTLQQIKSADIPYLSVIALDLLNEAKLSEQITSFNAIQDKLVDLGFGDMKISWKGTKKKIKDFKPGKRLDNITLEKTHNTLLKKNLIRYDGNSYNVTVNGQKNFKSTLQLEGKLTEAIQPSKAITKVLDMADGGYGKLGGKIVDGLSANLFKTVYNKANDTNKEKMNKMNEKQLYVFLTKLWSKFGKQVKI